MSDILEIQLLRVKVLNEIINIRNPNNSCFSVDNSYINGKLHAYNKVLCELEISIKKLIK